MSLILLNQNDDVFGDYRCVGDSGPHKWDNVLRCIFNQMEIPNGQKKYSKELKAQIALDAIKGQKTIAELAS